ncbi:MAG: NUDIX domain-containing protein [Defluviitaleaceae bacterium]|nr:NUDIX domain-containing protein [Defluviitaleaceae bacterium]
MEVRIYSLNELSIYDFVVIFARFGGKWVLCRHRERDTYEIPGGRIEQSEPPMEAAKRELYEETGAESFTLRAMFDYSVTRDGCTTNGQVYLAEISRLGMLPQSEIAEAILMNAMPPPEKMTYPAIQPLLYIKINEMGWI